MSLKIIKFRNRRNTQNVGDHPLENNGPGEGNVQAVASVTVMISVRKSDCLDEQLLSILAQTAKPEQIWVIQYEKCLAVKEIVEKYKQVFPRIYNIISNVNRQQLSLFTIALNISSVYTWIIDDNLVPDKLWLERCLERCAVLNSIITSVGRIITKDNFRPEMVHQDQETTADYACNNYFFKSEWISAFWSTWPISFHRGDGIHLCASCKTKLNVITTVLQQTSIDEAGNVKCQYGWDENEFRKGDDLFEMCEEVIKCYIQERHWIPIRWNSSN